MDFIFQIVSLSLAVCLGISKSLEGRRYRKFNKANIDKGVEASHASYPGYLAFIKILSELGVDEGN